MKQAIISITAIILLGACYNTSAPKRSLKSDTAITYVQWYVPKFDSVRYDHFYRIVKDTFSVTSIDTAGNDLVSKRTWNRDTFYYAPFIVAITDSAGKAVKSSKGRDSLRLVYELVPKDIILKDFNKRFK